MPVLNLEKPGRFKKGGIAMKKPVAKKKGGTTAKSDYYSDAQPSPRETKGDEITRDNERFLAGKIANEVKLFVDGRLEIRSVGFRKKISLTPF
jgi:hypothetical protein